MRTTKRLLAVAGATVALVVLPVAAASAHPLGNFSVNRYDGLVIAPGEVRIDHVQDLAEIPTVQAKGAIDADGDGVLAAGELSAWAGRECRRAAGAMSVSGAGAPLVGASSAVLRPGQAGLPTLRLECSMTVGLASGVGEIRFADHDRDGASGPGWREVTARGDRMTLTASDVPARSVSGRLTAYPQDMLSSPLAVDGATLHVTAGGAALAPDAAPPMVSALPRGVDGLTRWLSGLVAHRALTPAFAALALGAALVLGALHALAPGHGKTIMAAAAAGAERRSLKDVLALGSSVAVTHTAGVAVLGTLIAGGAAFAPSVFGWLTAASGALVVGAGIALLVRAIRGRGHGHGHTHDHGYRHHQHGDVHGHHGQDHAHDQDHDHDHARPRDRRGPVLLGFAGGLVPSPSAVLILVAAAALGRLWFGVLLVLAYGVGLAACLATVGLVVVRLGDRLRARAPQHRLLTRLTAVLPIGTAGAVVVLGAALAARGLGVA